MWLESGGYLIWGGILSVKLFFGGSTSDRMCFPWAARSRWIADQGAHILIRNAGKKIELCCASSKSTARAMYKLS